jgi:hypothetical protein
MTLYAHIVGGVLVSVGDLPVEGARRLDTNQWVVGDEFLSRLKATGYFPLDVDPATVTDDPLRQEVLAAALLAAQAGDTTREEFAALIDDTIGAIKASSWDFIDAYSPVPVPGSQDPGLEWPEGALSLGLLAQRIAVLRLEATRTAIQKIKIANLLAVLRRVVLERDATWTPPADR